MTIRCHTPFRIVGSARNQLAERPMKRLDITSTFIAIPISPASASLRHRSNERPDAEQAPQQNGLALSSAATQCVALQRGTESESPAATQCIALERGTLNDRLETLRATFEKNRHRYAFRRRAVIDEMFVLAATERHVNALGEALEAWLPNIESIEYPAPAFPHAMAA